jgi:hypothetical protein
MEIIEIITDAQTHMTAQVFTALKAAVGILLTVIVILMARERALQD